MKQLSEQRIKNDAMSVFETYLRYCNRDKTRLKSEWLSISKTFTEERFKRACKFIKEHKEGFDRLEKEWLDKHKV